MESKMALSPTPPYPYDGPPDSRAPILAALRGVIDPEVALNIVDIGLVYGVRMTADRLHVLATMTSAACPVADVIMEDIHAALGAVVPEGVAVEIELVWEPEWTPERMSDRAKAFMGW